MAGIKVPQYDIFKISTKKLSYYQWNLDISLNDAYKTQEIVSLFEGQEFRLIAQILGKPTNEVHFEDYIAIIVIENSADFKRATNKKGLVINGHTFKRFVGTNGGIKNNSLIFVNTEVLDELNRRCECGMKKDIKLIPAKYESYKALTCSASQPIVSPRKILVVDDCLINIRETVLEVDNRGESVEPVVTLKDDYPLENNVSDGYNLCTIEYMRRVAQSLGLNYTPSGVCLRNAWLKGMLYPFPIKEFVEEINGGNSIVKDIWGNEQDLREVEMILTGSSLKLWNAYDSIDDYVQSYIRNGYCFSVTKIAPEVLEDERELNYQYLQSYDFDDADIEELCAPTVKFLKDSMCGDHEQTKKFLGLNANTEKYTWQEALLLSEYMMGDPYVIEQVHRMIRKKIDQAKIGKIRVHGNYQLASGDPYALMQSICGLPVTGLLKAHEAYSQYWSDESVGEIVCYRSPMTSHNNIRKVALPNTEEQQKWYRYMHNAFIINGFDSFCQAENGCDFDSDLIFTTNNSVLLRRHRALPAIICVQDKAEKVEITEEAILKSNKNGMGNRVGSITNRATSMMEVMTHFDKDSKEYKEIEKRIICGQLYQQDEIDKIKGIIAKPMPTYWYSYHSCDNDFQRSICANKRPYFMTYVYDDYRSEYKRYIKETNKTAILEFGESLLDILNKKDKNEQEQQFEKYFYTNNQFGMGDCAVNRICRYVEQQLDDIKIQVKNKSNFDYTVFREKRNCTVAHRAAMKDLQKEYVTYIRGIKTKQGSLSKDEKVSTRVMMRNYFKARAAEICPDERERYNIILDMCYTSGNNRQFCWDCIGDMITRKLANDNI